MGLLTKYKKSFKGDLIGGITAAIVAIPLGLGFGDLSGLGPEAGLYAAIILAIIASLIGGTQTLISDPTAPMAFVAGVIIAQGISLGDPGVLDSHAWVHIILTFALAGIFQILFGVIKVAQYVKFIPYPVISGFMGGIGIIIMIGQLFPLMGHASPKGAINIFSEISEPLGAINTWAVILGIGTIAVIYIVPLITNKIPSVLVALIVMTCISLALPVGSFDIVGVFQGGLPSPKLGVLVSVEFQDILNVVVPAITLASLGTIDTLLTSVVADNMTKTKHNGNRELMGQGLGNFVGAFFGALPGAGSTTGTVINIKSGGTTHLSGIIKGVFLILVLLFLAPAVKFIPLSVLAGILFTIGVGVMDLKGLRMLLKVPRADSAILLVTLFVTVFDTLLHAVAIGALMAVVTFMKKMSEVMEDTNKEGDLGSFTRDDRLPEELLKKIYVKKLEGPMFFGFADQFREQMKSIEGYEAVIIDMKQVPFIDETGLLTLEDSVKDLYVRKIAIYISGANESIYTQFEKVKIPGNLVPEDHFFPYFKHCVKHLRNKYKYEQGLLEKDVSEPETE
jgi:SulP family sulfate permease